MEVSIDPTRSDTMREALVRLERVAPSDLSVIIYGERGTGKEWAARRIHQLSNRASAPFYVVDCAALRQDGIEKEIFGYEVITWNGIDIRKSAFEEAAGGTLFLNGFSTLPLALQLKIARAVEYKKASRIGGEQAFDIEVRLIATVTSGTEHSASENEDEEDVHSRIAAIGIHLPPLRERKGDIPLLIGKFLEELRSRYGSTVKGISDEAMNLCCLYDWPGNVRHLKNALEYASIMCGSENILPKHLPGYLQPGKRKQKENHHHG